MNWHGWLRCRRQHLEQYIHCGIVYSLRLTGVCCSSLHVQFLGYSFLQLSLGSVLSYSLSSEQISFSESQLSCFVLYVHNISLPFAFPIFLHVTFGMNSSLMVAVIVMYEKVLPRRD